MLTDGQIMELAPRMNIPLVGCYFKNDLPNIEIGKSYIVNLENDVDEQGNISAGTHWIAFQIFRTHSGLLPLFFDSFGFGAPAEVADKIATVTNKKIGFSTRQIQSPSYSGACGWYCLAWLHYMNMKHRSIREDLTDRYNDFVSMFDPENQQINDQTLKLFFRSRPEQVNNIQPPEDTSLE